MASLSDHSCEAGTDLSLLAAGAEALINVPKSGNAVRPDKPESIGDRT
jgi:hypothetical protein